MAGFESPWVPQTPELRTCIQFNSPLFAQACGSCMLHDQTGSCDILNAAVAWNTEHRKRFGEHRDTVIPDFLTIQGVMARLDDDPALASEFVEGNTGVVYTDVRGLHIINDQLSRTAGNHLLQQAAVRLTSAHDPNIPSGGLRIETESLRKARPARQRQQPRERRKDPTEIRDIGYRGTGADELAVVVRNVNPVELRRIATRIEELFSVDRAIADSDRGELPLVATVTYAHVEDLGRQYTNPADLFLATHEEAGKRHVDLKGVQYGEMWYKVRETFRATGQKPPIKPDDPRRIYRYFVNMCCSGFANHLDEYYAARGITIKSRAQRLGAGGGGGNVRAKSHGHM